MSAPYREPPPAPPDPYLAAWSRLRRRRLALRAGTVCLFVFVAPAIAMSLVPLELRVTAMALGLTIAIPAGLLMLSLLPPFQCPGCGEPFFLSGGAEVGRSTRCCHCDLAVGTRAKAPVRDTAFARVGPRRIPLARSFRWLVLTLMATFIGYHAGRDTLVATAILALGVAGMLTISLAQLMQSKAFPRALLVPMLALTLSWVLAARANQLEERAWLDATHRAARAACVPRQP